MKKLIYFLLIVTAFTSCATRYGCPQPTAQTGEAIKVLRMNINRTFKTVVRWDSGGVYDTVNLIAYYKPGKCLTKCLTSKSK